MKNQSHSTGGLSLRGLFEPCTVSLVYSSLSNIIKAQIQNTLILLNCKLLFGLPILHMHKLKTFHAEGPEGCPFDQATVYKQEMTSNG